MKFSFVKMPLTAYSPGVYGSSVTPGKREKSLRRTWQRPFRTTPHSRTGARLRFGVRLEPPCLARHPRRPATAAARLPRLAGEADRIRPQPGLLRPRLLGLETSVATP